MITYKQKYKLRPTTGQQLTTGASRVLCRKHCVVYQHSVIYQGLLPSVLTISVVDRRCASNCVCAYTLEADRDSNQVVHERIVPMATCIYTWLR